MKAEATVASALHGNGSFLDAHTIELSSSDDDRLPPPGILTVATRVKSRKRKSVAATTIPVTTGKLSKTKPCSPQDLSRRAMTEIQNKLPRRRSLRQARVSRVSRSDQDDEAIPRSRSSSVETGNADHKSWRHLFSDDCLMTLDSSEEEPFTEVSNKSGKNVKNKDEKKIIHKENSKPRTRRRFGPKNQISPPPSDDDIPEEPILVDSEDEKSEGKVENKGEKKIFFKESSGSKANPQTRKRFGPRKQASPPPPSDEDISQEPILVDSDDEEEDKSPCTRPKIVCPRKGDKLLVKSQFVGKPIPAAQAKKKWPQRYDKVVEASAIIHYEEAVVDEVHYHLGDCVAVNGEESEYIGKVIEFFKTKNQENWFRVRWFFRLSDTSIGNLEDVDFDEKRLFLSADEDDNNIECILRKVKVTHAPRRTDYTRCDFYFDMGYSNDLSTFYKVYSDGDEETSPKQAYPVNGSMKTQLTLLDLYCGCGAMSTGLSMGAALGGVELTTKWAVDYNEHACNSMKHNHPETEVRNEDAECFLLLLKEWQKLCAKYEGSETDEKLNDRLTFSEDEYEVEQVVGIRMAEIEKPRKPDTSSKMPDKPIKRQLEFQVKWKGYTSDDNTWEPVEHLNSCEERIREFVVEGRKRQVLPLPGDVDMVCGGPPCQGASGFNRFRNAEAPLSCPRNRQMSIYMDIVDFLRPKFVLMENVVDILKFREGLLGRYAMFRLVDMRYQAKLGMLAAGSYGLPQFRMRVFLWGAAPTEALPPFPLPTHDTIYRRSIPNQFSRNVVTHTGDPHLAEALYLKDAISDLPPVGNFEKRDDMPYQSGPKTPFQTLTRKAKNVFYGRGPQKMNLTLHDHLPLELNADDYQRSCRIPKQKGANFRDLGGLLIKADNSVTLDLAVKREYLPSGKPLVPDYAISFIKGRSLKPFARMWWDETVPTVITRAEPHNHRMLHPTQDRVLTVRENARLQGFPDWYKLTGPVKERYIQVGNAVAVPVARALGYSLALSKQQICKQPRLQLPAGFPVFESKHHDCEMCF